MDIENMDYEDFLKADEWRKHVYPGASFRLGNMVGPYHIRGIVDDEFVVVRRWAKKKAMWRYRVWCLPDFFCQWDDITFIAGPRIKTAAEEALKTVAELTDPTHSPSDHLTAKSVWEVATEALKCN